MTLQTEQIRLRQRGLSSAARSIVSRLSSRHSSIVSGQFSSVSRIFPTHLFHLLAIYLCAHTSLVLSC